MRVPGSGMATLSCAMRQQPKESSISKPKQMVRRALIDIAAADAEIIRLAGLSDLLLWP